MYIIIEIQYLIREIWRNELNEWRKGNNLSNFQEGRHWDNIELSRNIHNITSLLGAAHKILLIALLRRLDKYAKDVVADYQTEFRRQTVYLGYDSHR